MVEMLGHDDHRRGISRLGGVKDKRIYVERRPEGDYAVRRANSNRASDVLHTQHQAIEWARELSADSRPHVDRSDTLRSARPTYGGGLKLESASCPGGLRYYFFLNEGRPPDPRFISTF